MLQTQREGDSIRKKKERKILALLTADTDESVRFFSGAMKPSRERSICAAFLRCLGVTFSVDEVRSSEKEPPDVVFRSAQFEVCEVPDQGRKRHDEYKAEARWRRGAKSVRDVLRPYRSPVSMPYREVLKLVTTALSDKSTRYGQRVCVTLDALVYVDLLGSYIATEFGPVNTEELARQGWRSVSLLMPPVAQVVCAADAAPGFIRDAVSGTKARSADLTHLFDL